MGLIQAIGVCTVCKFLSYCPWKHKNPGYIPKNNTKLKIGWLSWPKRCDNILFSSILDIQKIKYYYAWTMHEHHSSRGKTELLWTNRNTNRGPLPGDNTLVTTFRYTFVRQGLRSPSAKSESQNRNKAFLKWEEEKLPIIYCFDIYFSTLFNWARQWMSSLPISALAWVTLALIRPFEVHSPWYKIIPAGYLFICISSVAFEISPVSSIIFKKG